jgi:type I restriction enzyme S subunit
MELKRGYKQTAVGVIPDEWDVRTLGNLLEQPRSVRYGIVQPGRFSPTGCLMLRSQDYSKGWAEPDAMHRVNSQLENQYRNARIRRNDLIMTVVGAGIGQVVIVPAWLDGAILSRSTARIAVDEKQASTLFVKASLESPIGKRQILDCQKEGAQPVVSCQDLAKFLVPYPPRLEQRLIAAALSDVDALLVGLDQIIAKKRDLKQAAMQQVLNGHTRLPGFHDKASSNRKFKLTEIGEIPEDWSLDCIENIAHITTGSRNTQDKVEDGQFPFFVRSQKVERINSYSFDGEAVLTAGDGVGTGKVFHYINGKFDLHQRVYRISEFSARVNGYFFYLYFSSRFYNRIMQMTAKSSVDSVRREMIGRMLIPLPTIDEQTAIAEVQNEMGAELAALEQQRFKTQALKQAMMQELLTGKTRLL